MDDKFLYQLQEQPDAEFARTLQRQLAQPHSEPKRRFDMSIHNLINNKRLVQVAALFMIAIIAVMSITSVRAFVASFITNIAGQLFEVTADYPGDNYGEGEEIIEPQVMSLGDALAAFPHGIQLPTNIPSEYTLDEDNVRVYVGENAGPFDNTIEFGWRSTTQNSFILLHITDRDLTAIGEIVAPNSAEEILLDEAHTAVLIRGGWNVDQKAWVDDTGIRLRWSIGDLFYDLTGTDQEQLLEIAKSTLK